MDSDASGDGVSHQRMARRYLIHGRVQGVGYRWWAQKSASLAGVDGYARNLDDGSARIQLFAGNAWTEQFAEFSKLSLGDWIGAEGEVVKTRTGELSVKVAKRLIGLRPEFEIR